jgi:hypothetical protein
MAKYSAINFDTKTIKELDNIMAKGSIFRDARKDGVKTKLSDDWDFTDAATIRVEVIRSGANEAILNTEAEISSANQINFDTAGLSEYEKNIKDGNDGTLPAVYVEGQAGVDPQALPADSEKDTNYTEVGGLSPFGSSTFVPGEDTIPNVVRIDGNAPYTRAKDSIITSSYEAKLGQTLMTNFWYPRDLETFQIVKGRVAKFMAITERTKAKRYDKYVLGKAIVGGNLNLDLTNTTSGKLLGLDAINLETATPEDAAKLFKGLLTQILDIDYEGRDVADYEFVCTYTFAELLREKLRLIESDSAFSDTAKRPPLVYEGITINPIPSARLQALGIDCLRKGDAFSQEASGLFLNEKGVRKADATNQNIANLIASGVLKQGSTKQYTADGRFNPEFKKYSLPLAGVFLNKNAHVAPYKFTNIDQDNSYNQGPNNYVNTTYLYDAFTKPMREDWTIPIINGTAVA